MPKLLLFSRAPNERVVVRPPEELTVPVERVVVVLVFGVDVTVDPREGVGVLLTVLVLLLLEEEDELDRPPPPHLPPPPPPLASARGLITINAMANIARHCTNTFFIK